MFPRIEKAYYILNMKKNTIIVDLDGTLALVDKRRELAMKPNGKINWDIFLDPNNIKLDEPDEPTITMVKLFSVAGFKIFIFSGRTDRTEKETRKWLANHDVPFDKLVMRNGDQSKKRIGDEIIKKEMLDNHADINDVFLVIDDRQKVVNMWRENGLKVAQMDKGDF